MFNHKHLILIVNAFLLMSCATATLYVRSPAEINTREISKVAVGTFEIGQLEIKFKTERNGAWETHPLLLKKEIRVLTQLVLIPETKKRLHIWIPVTDYLLFLY